MSLSIAWYSLYVAVIVILVFWFIFFRFFYASSACIYPEFKQLETNVSLKESDAWPAEVCCWFFELLVQVILVIHLKILRLAGIYLIFDFYSHKMHMGWRSLQQKSYASIITRILELSAALGDSITYMVLMGHGRVCSWLHCKFLQLLYLSQ